MDPEFILERREQIDPVPETSEALKRMSKAVAMAREGAPFYAYSHPDYFTVPQLYYPGAFPDHVKERIWTHIGFKGSLEPGAARSTTPQIHGLWQLDDSMYVYFVFTDGEAPAVKATFANTKGYLISNMPTCVFDKYLVETRVVLPRFTPPCSPILKDWSWGQDKENSCASDETDEELPPLIAPSPRPEFQEPLHIKSPVAEKIDLTFP